MGRLSACARGSLVRIFGWAGGMGARYGGALWLRDGTQFAPRLLMSLSAAEAVRHAQRGLITRPIEATERLPSGGLFCLAVPELTRSADIKLNNRVSLQPRPLRLVINSPRVRAHTGKAVERI
jgi:hypothetical protein